MRIAAIDALVIDRDTSDFIETFLGHAQYCAASRDDRDALLERLRSALVAAVVGAVRAEDQRNLWRRVYFEVRGITCTPPQIVASAESFEYVQSFLRENVDLLGVGSA